MSSIEQDDLRSASEALRKTLRFDNAQFSAFCELAPRRYAAWERGAVDLQDEELANVRLAMLGLAQQQKCVADKCLSFARRHQDASLVLLSSGACGQA
jgi:hypothetical protein